jgi:hypothetical protein
LIFAAALDAPLLACSAYSHTPVRAA